MFRIVLLTLVPFLACDLFPWRGSHAGSGDGGAANPEMTSGGDAGSPGEGDPPMPDGAAPSDGEPDASWSDSAAAEPELISAPPSADVSALAVAASVSLPGWGTGNDAGAPASAALPAAAGPGAPLALSPTSANAVGPGCGEPPLCYLRMSLRVASGRVYTAWLSSFYPSDICARDVIDDGRDILIGDSKGRCGELRCSGVRPQITVGFVIPNAIVDGANETWWRTTDGYRSQWTLSSGFPADDGLYLPRPGEISYADIIALHRIVVGEAYGTIVVPLHHQVTGAQAVGEVLFDVRLRR